MGLQVSAQQLRLWALRREEGEDRGWGHASPGACVPQFLRNKPCWMKTRQTVLRAYKAPVFLSCDPFRAQGLHHHPDLHPVPWVWLAQIHPSHTPKELQAAAKPGPVQPLLLGCQHKGTEAPQGLCSLSC